MDAFVYYISLPFIYLISLLPFPALYLLSDFLYLILFKIIGYRKKVILHNLSNSFPHKTEVEIQAVAHKFYHYFCDLTLETIKTLTITPASLKRHVVMKDVSVFQQYYAQKQSVIIVMGHMGNWELAGAMFSQEPFHKLYVIYHPLHNKYFDRLFYHMRTRLGNRLYAMNDVLRGMLKDRDKVTATAFIADQTPSPQGAYWTTFLQQDTPIFNGTAKIARKLNYPIVYVSVKRVKRGKYTVNTELLAARPSEMTEEEISELHTRRLEKDIIEQTEIWLWTHRRWKHSRV